MLRGALERLPEGPEGIDRVYLGADTAGYQQDLLKYCDQGKNKRFGVIECAIMMDVNTESKKAVAKAEWAEWHP